MQVLQELLQAVVQPVVAEVRVQVLFYVFPRQELLLLPEVPEEMPETEEQLITQVWEDQVELV
jgi:hypothetical protein